MVALCLLNCTGSTRSPRDIILGQPVNFVYYTAKGERLTSTALRGRVTVVIFVTTFDSASQLEVRALQSIVRRHVPRINALVVVLEAPQYAPLTTVYAESLELTMPVVISDFATHSGEGAFGDLSRVPTLVILDEQGRPRWRQEGSVSGGRLERMVREATGPAQ